MKPDLLIATLKYILPKKDEFSKEFYAQLFIRSQEAYNLFAGLQTNMGVQRDLLIMTLAAVVSGIKEHPYETIERIQILGQRHYQYGVSSDLYPVVSDVLLDTLKTFLKEAWTPEKEHAWREALQIIQGNMLKAYPLKEQ